MTPNTVFVLIVAESSEFIEILQQTTATTESSPLLTHYAWNVEYLNGFCNTPTTLSKFYVNSSYRNMKFFLCLNI